MSIHLLEMYRIDGKFDEYNETINILEKKTKFLNPKNNTEFNIEKIKNMINNFQYLEALESIKKIKNNNIETKIQSACLYSQLGDKEKSSSIINKISAELAQKKYSDDKMTYLNSYLNICERSLKININNKAQNIYPYDDNNIMKILNDLKNNVINGPNSFKKESGKYSSFNPNTYTENFSTKDFTNEFRYLLFIDKLCLPIIYKEHLEIISISSKRIIETSKNPLWKWSRIIRTNNEKIIEEFFTRELIVSSDKKWSNEIFDNIIKILNLYDDNNRIIHKNILLKVLSRLSIMDRLH